MPRGFTLFELVITTAVLAILLMSAGPSFVRLFEKQNMKRFAGDLEGFFIQAKSESVLKNQSLKLFYVEEGDNWLISLNPEVSVLSDISNIKVNSIAYLSSDTYTQINISSSVSSLVFNPVRATPHMPASFLFYEQESRQLKLSIHNITGRIKICAKGGTYYDYKKC